VWCGCFEVVEEWIVAKVGYVECHANFGFFGGGVVDGEGVFWER
jgi:hypothetical protein